MMKTALETISIILPCILAAWGLGELMARRAIRKKSQEWQIRCGRSITLDSTIMEEDGYKL